MGVAGLARTTWPTPNPLFCLLLDLGWRAVPNRMIQRGEIVTPPLTPRKTDGRIPERRERSWKPKALTRITGRFNATVRKLVLILGGHGSQRRWWSEGSDIIIQGVLWEETFGSGGERGEGR